jgi:hypothetical protein
VAKAALLAVFATGLALPRAAAADAELEAWLDPDAPVAIRLEAGELERLAGLARSIGGEAGGVTALATLGGVRFLGFDPLSRRGWQSAGLDGDAPAMLQLPAIDSAATDKVYRELGRTSGQWGTHRDDSPPLWRSRLVVRAADPARAIAALTGGRLVDRATAVEAGRAAELAAVLGASRGRGAAVVRDLAALGVVAVATVPDAGALLFVRRKDAVVVVDLIAPFAGDALEWRRDRDALRAALGRRGRGNGGAAGRAAALAGPGLVLWTHPLGLYHVGQAYRASEQLRLRFAGGALPDLARGCGKLRSLEKATLTDLAVALRVEERALMVTARYGHRGPLAGALAPADHPVVAGLAATDLHGRLAVAQLAAVRRLARPALHAGGWDAVWQQTGWCGEGATALVYGFSWPELAALWLDELVAAMPEVAPVIGGLGSVGVALDQVAAARTDLLGVVEIAADSAALELVAAGLDAVFGTSRDRERPRPHRAWGRGPLHPSPIAGEPGVLGAGFGKSTRWRLGALRPPTTAATPTAAPAPPLLAVRGRLDRLLPVLTAGGRWAALGKAAAARVASFRLDGGVATSALELSLTIELRP